MCSSDIGKRHLLIHVFRPHEACHRAAEGKGLHTASLELSREIPNDTKEKERWQNNRCERHKPEFYTPLILHFDRDAGHFLWDDAVIGKCFGERTFGFLVR